MKSLKKGGSGREGGERTEDDNSAPSSITHSFAVYKSKDFEKKGLGGMVFSMMCGAARPSSPSPSAQK